MADFQTTVELKAQTGQMTQKLNQTTRQLKQVSTQVRKTQGAFTRMGKKVSGTFTRLNSKIKEHRNAIAGIAVSLGLVIGKGVKDFKEWEDGLAQIATLGVTGIKGISDELDAVRREFGISGKEATKGYYDIISAGAKQGAEAMGQLTAATKLAKAGNTDLAAAIDVVTSGMNIFGDNGETATSIVDQLFLAVKYGKTTVEELGKTFGYVAPVIDAAGLSMADYAASMATITAGGIATKQATTGLKAVLSNLIKVTPKAAKKAAELGLDFGVAALKAKGLVGVMQDIADATGGDVTQLGHLFDSIEAINAVAVLTSGTGLKNLERNFNAMSDSAGTTAEALEKVKKTASYNFGKFNQGLSIMSRSIGAAVIPSLLGMADALAPVVDFLSALITKHPGIVTITASVVALGVALAFLGGPITLGILATGVAIKALVDHFDLFADGGVAALEKIELVWNNFWAGFKDKSLGESINHIFSGIGDWVTTLLPEGGFTALWDTTKGKLSEFWTKLTGWYQDTDWKGLWDGVLVFAGDIWGGIETLLTLAWTSASKWFQSTNWKGLWDGTLEFAGDIWRGVKYALSTAWDGISGWFTGVDWKGLWYGTGPHGGGLLEFTGNIWEGIKNALSAAWTGITEWFSNTDWKGLWKGTLLFTGKVWEGIKVILDKAWTGISGWFTSVDWKGLWTGVLVFSGNVWSGIKIVLDKMWTSLTAWFTSVDWKGLWAGTLEFTGKVWEGIKTILDKAWTGISGWFADQDWKGLWAGTLVFAGNIWSAIETGLTKMWGSLTGWFSEQNWAGLWAGTLSFVGNVWTGVKTGLTKMWESLTGWFGNQNWDGLWSGTLAFVGNVWTGVKEGLTKMWGSLTKWFTDQNWDGLWAGTLAFVGDIWVGIKTVLDKMWTSVTTWFTDQNWKGLWAGVLEFTGNIWESVSNKLVAAGEGIDLWFQTVDWSKLWVNILGFSGDIWDGVNTALSTVWTGVTAWFAATNWEGMWKDTTEFTVNIWEGIKSALDTAWTNLTQWHSTVDWDTVAYSIGTAIRTAFIAVFKFGAWLAEGITDGIAWAATAITSGDTDWSAVFQGLMDAVTGVAGFIGKIILAAFGIKWSDVEVAWDQLKTDIATWFDELSWGSMWDGLTDGLVDIGSSVVDTVTGWFDIDWSGMWNGMVDALRGVGSQITSMFIGFLPDWVQNLIGGGSNASVTDDGGTGRGSIAALNKAAGGSISGAGTGTSDSIPAMLSNGEFVMNAKSARMFMPLLEAMNKNKYAKGGAVGKVIQKYAAGGTVGDAKSYQFLQFEEGLFSMQATIDKFTKKLDLADPAVVKVTRQMEYLEKHTDNLNKDQVLQHDYATRINQALIELLGDKKKEGEVTAATTGAVKDLGTAAKDGAEGLAATKNEFEGFGQAFTGPIKQAMANGGSIGDAFKAGARGLFQKLASKFLDKAFAPLEKAIDEGLNSLFSNLSSQASSGQGGIGGFFSSLLGGGGPMTGNPHSSGKSSGIGGFIGSLFGMSTGGIVPKRGMRPQYFAQGGMAKGTDTVPAMLTPGEMVLNKDQQGMLGGGGTTYNTYNLDISGNVDQRAIEQIRSIIQNSPNQVNQASQRGERERTGLRPSNRR